MKDHGARSNPGSPGDFVPENNFRSDLRSSASNHRALEDIDLLLRGERRAGQGDSAAVGSGGVASCRV